jgi:hypothetical protein
VTYWNSILDAKIATNRRIKTRATVEPEILRVVVWDIPSFMENASFLRRM